MTICSVALGGRFSVLKVCSLFLFFLFLKQKTNRTPLQFSSGVKMYLSQKLTSKPHPSPKLTPVRWKQTQKHKSRVFPDSDKDTKDPVHVYCRLCPSKNDSSTNYMEQTSSQEIRVKWNIMGAEKELLHKFKQVFNDQSTQEEIYTEIAHPLVQDLFEGKSGLLFSYGVTASGKTYTLQGTQENPGILPRCINVIFNSVKDYQTLNLVVKPDKMNGFEIHPESNAMRNRLTAQAAQTPKSDKGKYYEKLMFNNNDVKVPIQNKSYLYAVFITYIEIYNNTVYDLLESSDDYKPRSKIISHDLTNNMYVNGVMEVEVKTSEEAYALLRFGQNQRKRGKTLLNKESSRSHSIFTIRLVQFDKEIKNAVSDQDVIISQLSLVDLAGSERTNRTQNSGVRLKESAAINNSLMTLRSCIDTLRENQHSDTHKIVPYRNSRLTMLFKNYFEGNGSVHMIICIAPTVPNLNENLQVMKFAECSQNVIITRSKQNYTPVTIKYMEKATTSEKSPPAFQLPTFDFCGMGFDSELENNLTILKTFNDNTLKGISEMEKKLQIIKKQIIKVINPSTPSSTPKPTNQNPVITVQSCEKFEKIQMHDKSLRDFLKGKVQKACAQLNMGNGIDKEAHDGNR